MLFDLRGRGRRRVVQVIYLSLAILMGGGLVLFGIGSDTSGGLVDAFSGEDGNNSDADKEIDKQITRAENVALRSPKNPAVWVSLTKLRFQAANIGDGFDQNTSAYTQDGRVRLRAADQSWQRYLALEPRNPDDRVASLMVQAYGAAGINQPAKAVRAQEIVIDGRAGGLSKEQRSNLFAQLALLAYQAKQDRKGDLAAGRAVELAGTTQKKLLRTQIDQAKKQIAQQLSGGPQGATPPSG